MNRCIRIGVGAVAALAISATARAQVGGFSVVSADHWAAPSIIHLVTAGVLQKAPADPVSGKKSAAAKPRYDGAKPVTRFELALTLYRFVQYLERVDKQKKNRMGAQAAPTDGAAAARRLVAEGYLPQDTFLLKEGSKVVTADQLAKALQRVIIRARQKSVPVSPDSTYGEPIDRPSVAPGS